MKKPLKQPKTPLKYLHMHAWELFYAEEFVKLERVMLAMAEQYPEQHRVLAKNMAAAIHDQHDLDCLEEIGL